MARKLTDKQQRFVDEYLIDLNATQAAIRAGYSEKTAEQQAYQLLQKTSVQEAIASGKQSRSEKTAIDAAYVLTRLVEIDQMDVLDILDDAGNVLPVRQWPKCWRRTISGIDVNEIMSGDVESVIKKIKWPDKVKNLELIGKHVDVQAFKDQLGVSGGLKISHEDALDELA
jgi:phage terminase small subunit